MAETKTLMTIEEFDALPDEPGVRYELIEGELHVLASPRYYHQDITAFIMGELRAWAKSHGGAANHNTDFEMADNTVLAPDVYYLSAERLARIDPHKRNDDAPDLCIEVWSPANERQEEDLRRKAKIYLANGAKAVWLIYPEARIARIYKPGKPVEIRDEDQALEDTELLPGFSLKLSEVL
ncbi:MAG TPA: Uma2 family endonuclease [Terriglobia bacterium]|nr:Uma2 family endonuclease [Terriglobia bacterium]